MLIFFLLELCKEEFTFYLRLIVRRPNRRWIDMNVKSFGEKFLNSVNPMCLVPQFDKIPERIPDSRPWNYTNIRSGNLATATVHLIKAKCNDIVFLDASELCEYT